MVVTALKIAPGLALDADYVGGGTFALLAKKGAGKTYLARVMCEEFWKAKVPFVVLDPMDAFWGLRSAADGAGEGIPVAIFGGDHGDAPLEPTSGKLMADLVVDERLSMILSLKSFGTRKAERQFALDFLERLYRRNSELVHLLIDEADLFAPQKPAPGDQPLLGVTENIVRRGRNSGIGCTLITQRPAVLNKDVLTQVDGLVAMRIVGLPDRKAIDEWVKGHGDEHAAAEVKSTLAGLENGECWWWVPELGILKRVQVRATDTFDSSPTRRRGHRPVDPKGFADVDLSQIEEQMAATLERAKETDPKELRKRITELERQLAAKPVADDGQEVARLQARIAEIEVREPERVEVAVFPDSLKTSIRQDYESIAAHLDSVDEMVARARARLDVELEELHPPSSAPAPVQRQVHTPAPALATAPRVVPEPVDRSNGSVKIGKGERKVLGILAEYPEGRTFNEIAFLAGYSAKASTVGVLVSNLRKAGYIEDGNQPVRPTAAGLEAAGGAIERPTGRALLDQWFQHPRMGKGEREVLQALLDLHPEEPTNDELCAITGYSPTASTVGVLLSNLRKLGLVQKGARRLAPEFVGAVRA